MCITFLLTTNDKDNSSAHDSSNLGGGYQVIVTNNRDEIYNRPAKTAHFWPDYQHCLGGTDLEPGREGGTWFGVSKRGKIGMLLNILLNNPPDVNKKGRGHLVSDYLKSDITASEYIARLSKDKHLYNAFNLVLIEHSANKGWLTYYFCNTEEDATNSQFTVNEPHGVSNSTYDHPFVKVKVGQKKFKEIVDKHGDGSAQEKLENRLLDLMHDGTIHLPDPQLESQGQHLRTYGEEFLRQRSGIYVDSRKLGYGTRTSTVVTVSANGVCRYVEKNMKEPIRAENPEWETTTYEFDMNVKSNL